MTHHNLKKKIIHICLCTSAAPVKHIKFYTLNYLTAAPVKHIKFYTLLFRENVAEIYFIKFIDFLVAFVMTE